MKLEDLLNLAVDKRASDLHIIVGKSPILRIDGKLIESPEYQKMDSAVIEAMVYGVLTAAQKHKFIKNKELDFSYEIPKKSRFRINLHWERNNIGLTTRVVLNKIPTLEELAMPKIAYDFTELKDGLVLVTGPTGCGKSTTLASMINHINMNRSEKIVTIEDPIEYSFISNKSIIKQRQLGSDTLSFKNGLKHVLRQDPDIIMVGEMRDLETISSTITLAETGHLVFATLHTHNAPQTIDRIIDVFPPYQQTQIRLQLSLTLKGIISQRLLPKVDGGRLAVREILVNTPAIANMIRENKIPQIKSALMTGAEYGMISMDKSIHNLVESNDILEKVAQAYLSNKN